LGRLSLTTKIPFPAAAWEVRTNRFPSVDRLRLIEEVSFGLVATAILNRLLHHSHVLTIRGDSYGLRAKRKSRLIKSSVKKPI
jgi:hypothetical protein